RTGTATTTATSNEGRGSCGVTSEEADPSDTSPGSRLTEVARFLGARAPLPILATDDRRLRRCPGLLSLRGRARAEPRWSRLWRLWSGVPGSGRLALSRARPRAV